MEFYLVVYTKIYKQNRILDIKNKLFDNKDSAIDYAHSEFFKCENHFSKHENVVARKFNPFITDRHIVRMIERKSSTYTWWVEKITINK